MNSDTQIEDWPPVGALVEPFNDSKRRALGIGIVTEWRDVTSEDRRPIVKWPSYSHGVVEMVDNLVIIAEDNRGELSLKWAQDED